MRLWIWFSGLTRHAKPGQKALMQKHWCHNHCFCMFMRAVCILCVCVWSCCLKESSSDGAWKPCSAAVLPMHRQLHCWALNTRSALTLARTLYPSLWISLSLLFLSFHVLCLLKPFRLNPYIAPSNGSYIHFSSITWLIPPQCHGHVSLSHWYPQPRPLPPGWSQSSWEHQYDWMLYWHLNHKSYAFVSWNQGVGLQLIDSSHIEGQALCHHGDCRAI